MPGGFPRFGRGGYGRPMIEQEWGAGDPVRRAETGFAGGARADARPAWFLLLYALAHAGGVMAYLPLLSLLLPLKVEAIAGPGRVGLLALTAVAGAIAASVANIVFGALSDRSYAAAGTRRRWIAGGMAATCASFGAIHAANSGAAIVVAVVAFQVALNMMLAPLLAVMADEIPDGQKGTAAGMLSFAVPLGSIAGAALTALPLLGEGVRLAVLGGVVTAMIAPLLLVLGRVGPRRPEDPAPRQVRAARRIDLAFIWLSRLLVQTAAGVLVMYLLFYFERVAPAAAPLALASRVGQLSGVAFLLAVPLALVAGRASDALRARKPFLVAAAAGAAGGLAMMAAAHSWPPAMLGYVLFACGSAVFFGLQSAYAMQILPSPLRRGRDLGMLNLSNTLPGILGPALTWALASDAGFAPLLWTLAAMTLAGGLLNLPVRSER